MYELDLTGLFLPHITPFTEEGDLDEDGLVALIKRFNDVSDLGGLVSCARVGEGPVLTWEEQLRVYEVVSETKSADVPLVAGVAPQSTREAIEKIDQMESAGADAAMVFPPLLFAWGDVEPEFKIRFFEQVAENTSLPLVLFQVPIASYWYQPETVAEISHIDAVVAMKEASFNVQLFPEVVRAVQEDGGEMNLLSGNDRFVAQSFMLDIEGALIGVSNLATERWVDLVEAGREKRFGEAMDIQEELMGLKETIFAEPITEAPARIKYSLKRMGVIDSDYVRGPQIGIDDEEKQRLRKELDQLEV